MNSRNILSVVAALIAINLLPQTSEAQTLNIVQGCVTTQYKADQAGEMTYTDNGTTLTVGGKAFTISDIDQISIDGTAVTDNTVSISYDGATASVVVAGNVAPYITAEIDGAHVCITQTNTTDIDGDEITYSLSGTSTDGEFYLSGSYKCTVELNGLTLTNPGGAAVNIQNGKRIDISVKKDTENTLTDGSDGTQKACLVVKGHAEFKGNGTLNIYGNTKHGIKTGEYMTVKNCTLNILKAAGDGINVKEYFLMESGTIAISGVGDDGIQAEVDGTASTGETTDHEDEDSGNIYIEGGNLTIAVTAAAAKGIKAEGDMKISDGTLNVTTSGNGTYDSEENNAKGAAGLKTDGDMTISGGTLTLKSTGSGGKCIKADGTLTVSGGTIDATSTGSKYTYSSSITASPKAIKAGTRTEASDAATTRTVSSAPGGHGGQGGGPGGGGGYGGNQTNYTYSGGIVITGGTINASSTNHEAIESKSTIDISGGYIYAYSGDDAINSASDFTISGGYVMGNSSGNDGLDANGNFYIKGGNVFAVATSQPEVGIDANTEGGYKLYITGGNVVAIGGLENGSSLSGVTSKSVSYSKGNWYELYSGSTLAFSFKVPSNSRMGSQMTICTPSTPSVQSVSSATANIWNGYGYISK